MRCATLCTSLSRAGGGLFPIVCGLSKALIAQGVDVTVFGIRDGHTDDDRAAWGAVDARAFPRRGPSAFAYAPGLAAALDAARADVLHCHGLWQYPSVAGLRWAGRHGRPYVVSPQGMLDAWALANSRWKKEIAAFLFEKQHLRRAGCLHACSAAEAASFRRYGLRVPICVIPNGVDAWAPVTDPPPWTGHLPPGRKVLLFLGRLHPKKGLAELLAAWAATETMRGEWTLVIAGWDDGGHEADLRRQVGTLRLEDSVHFAGPLFGRNKTAALQHARAFVLPSFSEGMPMAVLEAWSAALPVLMTPACGIPEGFEAGAALGIEPNPGSIAEGLHRLKEMTDDARRDMGQRGRELVNARFTWTRVAAQTADVYRWLLGNAPVPACVQVDG